MTFALQCSACHASYDADAELCPHCGGQAERSPARIDSDAERQLLERAITGRYKIVRLIGRGGMGAVYLAWEHALERLVAIKVLPPGMATSLETRERFRREARALASVVHPNVVPLHVFGELDGLLYFVMGYVDGESLAERLARVRRLPADETRRVLAELADALDHAHRQGIIHRDIKPANVLIETATGRPMLADFGVATVRTSEHSRAEAAKKFGTPHYMSPEQALGEHVYDGRSDLYALGVLGYLMLTGRLPFQGASFAEIVAQHVTKDPPPIQVFAPGAPDDLVAAITRCLAKKPKKRWQDGKSLSQALLFPPPRPSDAVARLGRFARVFMQFGAGLFVAARVG